MPSLKFHEFCVNGELTFFINYIDGCKNLLYGNPFVVIFSTHKDFLKLPG